MTHSGQGGYGISGGGSDMQQRISLQNKLDEGPSNRLPSVIE